MPGYFPPLCTRIPDCSHDAGIHSFRSVKLGCRLTHLHHFLPTEESNNQNLISRRMLENQLFPCTLIEIMTHIWGDQNLSSVVE